MQLYTIAYALPVHVQRIAELEQELFPENWLSESTILGELERGPCFIALTANGVDGYLQTSLKEGVLDVLRVGVTRNAQGNGIGEALMLRVLDVPHTLCILTVVKDNIPALALYKKLGFELYGDLGRAWVLTKTSWLSIHDRSQCIGTVAFRQVL